MTECELRQQIIRYVRNNEAEPQLIELLRGSVKALSFVEKISDICNSDDSDFKNDVRYALHTFKQDINDEVYLWNYMKEVIKANKE